MFTEGRREGVVSGPALYPVAATTMLHTFERTPLRARPLGCPCPAAPPADEDEQFKEEKAVILKEISKLGRSEGGQPQQQEQQPEPGEDAAQQQQAPQQQPPGEESRQQAAGEQEAAAAEAAAPREPVPALAGAP